MSDAIELADEIMRFLKKHATDSASYDPDYDEPHERYSSPDASEMHVVAERLRAGEHIVRVPWSDWGSGGYSPYTDKDARAWHDELKAKIAAILAKSPRVSP